MILSEFAGFLGLWRSYGTANTLGKQQKASLRAKLVKPHQLHRRSSLEAGHDFGVLSASILFAEESPSGIS